MLECKATQGSQGEKIRHYIVGCMHIVPDVPSSKGCVGVALPADMLTKVEGVVPFVRVVVLRLCDGGACASFRLSPSGWTNETFERALVEIIVAVSWMEERSRTWWLGGQR